MPNYQFKCTKCEQLITVALPMGDPQTPKCLKCKEDMNRVFGVGAVTFNGGGWGKNAR